MPDPILEAIDLPFQEAIDFFRQKSRIPTAHWTDVWRTAHARGFMVAGAASDALLEDFQKAVARGIEEGTTLATFRKDFDQIVERHGWSYNGTPGWRSAIIYETNLSMAASAGRYRQLTDPDVLRHFPYWTYIHSGSSHPRLQHLAWNGLTLRADDPFWESHYPPNGWRCGCRVSPTSEADLARMGKSAPDPSPPIQSRTWINPKTGASHQVPVGIDPGFDYNVGQAWLKGAKSLPVRAPNWRPTAPEKVQEPVSGADIEHFIKAPHGRIAIGDMPDQARKALHVESPTVLLSDETMEKQAEHHPDLTASDYRQLPDLISDPDLVLAYQDKRLHFLRSGDTTLTGVVKATEDGKEVYLVSFRRARDKDVRRLLRRGKVIVEKGAPVRPPANLTSRSRKAVLRQGE